LGGEGHSTSPLEEIKKSNPKGDPYSEKKRWGFCKKIGLCSRKESQTAQANLHADRGGGAGGEMSYPRKRNGTRSPHSHRHTNHKKKSLAVWEYQMLSIVLFGKLDLMGKGPLFLRVYLGDKETPGGAKLSHQIIVFYAAKKKSWSRAC